MSHKHKGYLLATAAGSVAAAAAGGAQAADMPIKAPPPAPIAAPSWAGWYVGLNAGAAWEHVHAAGQFYTAAGTAFPTALDGTRFIGGGQIGYNWQNGNFVYGLEADLSGLSRGLYDLVPVASGAVLSSKINWVSTLRARAGLALAGSNLAYLTGGLAVAKIQNTVNAGVPGDLPNLKSESRTRAGWAAGGGWEHMLTSNWIVSAEALWLGFGHSTAYAPSVPGAGCCYGGAPTNSPKGTTFNNRAVIARMKVDYKF